MRFCQLNKNKQDILVTFLYQKQNYDISSRVNLRGTLKKSCFENFGSGIGSGIDFGCSGSKIPDPTQPYLWVWRCEKDFVRKISQRRCEKGVVTKKLWEGVVIKTLWERCCEKNFVRNHVRKALREKRWERHCETDVILCY